MAIVIRHATLSEKTQSAIAGIISKNEWNALHTLVEPILESDIQFNTATGHTHNGSNSTVADRVKTVQDSTSTSFYRVATPKPSADQIPITDGGGNICLKRSSAANPWSTQYLFYDTNGTTIRGSLIFNYNVSYSHIALKNNTSGHQIQLYDDTHIYISPGGSYGITNVAKNNFIFNSQAVDGTNTNYANIVFVDSGWGNRSIIRHVYSTNTTYDNIQMRHMISNAFIALDGNGDVAINSSGVGKKAYYIQSNGAFVAGREIAVKADIPTGSNAINQIPISNRVTNTGLWAERASILSSFREQKFIDDNFAPNLDLTFGSNQVLSDNLIICRNFQINSGITVWLNWGTGPLVIIARNIYIYGNIDLSGGAAGGGGWDGTPGPGRGGGCYGGTGVANGTGYDGGWSTYSLGGTGGGGAGGRGGYARYAGGSGGGVTWGWRYWYGANGGTGRSSGTTGGAGATYGNIYHVMTFLNWFGKHLTGYPNGVNSWAGVGGGAGGGGGQGIAYTGGGGGGGGGVCILIASNQLTCGASSNIYCQGGAGGNGHYATSGSPEGYSSSGGGGGGGGAIIRVGSSLSLSGATHVWGGSGGLTETNGGAGGPGQVINLDWNGGQWF